MKNAADLKMCKLLKEARLKKGLSQLDLSRRLDLTQPVFVSLIESGESRLPPRMALKYANILSIKKEKIINLMFASAKLDIIAKMNEGWQA